jgi:hypothetical protein
MPPDQSLAFKTTHGIKGNKNHMSLTLTTNATGTERLPVLFIGKFKDPSALKKKYGHQLQFNYYHKKNVWMMTAIFQNWLTPWNDTLREEGCKILSD